MPNTLQDQVAETERQVSATVFHAIVRSGVPIAVIAKRLQIDQLQLRKQLQNMSDIKLTLLSDILFECGATAQFNLFEKSDVDQI